MRKSKKASKAKAQKKQAKKRRQRRSGGGTFSLDTGKWAKKQEKSGGLGTFLDKF